MREFNALAGYPEPKNPRVADPGERDIHARIIASSREKEFFDGERKYGYGGFNYDGRWQQIARNIMEFYQLPPNAKILQILCEKGFLLHDFKTQFPQTTVIGTETSQYAKENAMATVKDNIVNAHVTKLPFKDNEFDFIIAIGALYIVPLSETIQGIREIERVGKGKSFITLASGENEREIQVFRDWSLLSSSVHLKQDWLEVLKHAGYRGDYKFTTMKSLNLVLP